MRACFTILDVSLTSHFVAFLERDSIWNKSSSTDRSLWAEADLGFYSGSSSSSLLCPWPVTQSP